MKTLNGKKLTGYPSIDRPWLKYYPKKPIRKFVLEQKMCNLIETANIDNLDNIAINFMGIDGNDWTYREIFHMVDRLADAYLQYGLKEKEVVLVSTVSGLDEALNLLALNKIGAISKWIDITASAMDLETAIVEDNCRIVVAFAAVVPELQKCIDDTTVERVLYSSPEQYIRTNKMPPEQRNFLQKGILEESLVMPQDERFIRLIDFLETGSETATFCSAVYEKDSPVLKIQSSGTTGKPKSIIHTDYSVNASINKLAYTDFPLVTGNTLLKIAPSWVGYGLINTLAAGLAHGMTVLMTPMINERMCLDYNGKYDVAFGVPLHYRYLASKIDDVTDMSRVRVLVSGGDKISEKEIHELQEIFATKGCSAPILNGAGNNEVLGVGSGNIIHANKPGTVGFPYFGDTIAIFDTETGEEKRYGEEGEICYCSESAFLEYANNVKETKRVKQTHRDGTIWIHSKDLGTIDEDGFITIIGRLSRVILVSAFKISASHIEEVVESHPAVGECVAVGVPDDIDGEVPMVFVVLKDGFCTDEDNIERELRSLCSSHLKEKAVPKYFQFIDAIPYTSNNKQDYRKLERIGRESM